MALSLNSFVPRLSWPPPNKALQLAGPPEANPPVVESGTETQALRPLAVSGPAAERLLR